MAFVDPETKRAFLSVAEVAKRWGMRPESVTRFHMKKGGLAGLPVGRMTLVPLSDLKAYEERLKRDIQGRIKRLKRTLKRLEMPCLGCPQEADPDED